jgi:hypothetical protein
MGMSLWFRTLMICLRAVSWAALTVLGAVVVGLTGVPSWMYWVLWPGFAMTDLQYPNLRIFHSGEFRVRVLLFSWLAWALVYAPFVIVNERRRAKKAASRDEGQQD